MCKTVKSRDALWNASNSLRLSAPQIPQFLWNCLINPHLADVIPFERAIYDQVNKSIQETLILELVGKFMICVQHMGNCAKNENQNLSV